MSAPRVCAACGAHVPGFHSYVRGWRCDACADSGSGSTAAAADACEWCGEDLTEMGSPNCRELCIECTGEDAGPCIECGAIGSGPCSECGAGSTDAAGSAGA